MIEVSINDKKTRFPAKPTMNVNITGVCSGDNSGNSGGSGGVSSWNDLTDKPFGSVYANAEPVVCVEDSSITINRVSTMSFYAKGNIATDFKALGVTLNNLGTIKVVFDGAEYTLSCRGIATNYSGYCYGNGLFIKKAYSETLSFDAVDTGEPIGIVLRENEITVCTDDDAIGTHTISLTYFGVTETITQIQEKYIPAPSIAPMNIEIYAPYAGSDNPGTFKIGNNTFDDLESFCNKACELFNNGHKLYGKVDYALSSEDDDQLYIIDAAHFGSGIRATATKALSYALYSIIINSYSIGIYEADGTDIFMKEYV